MLVDALLIAAAVASIFVVVWCWPRAGLPPVSRRCLARYRDEQQ